MPRVSLPQNAHGVQALSQPQRQVLPWGSLLMPPSLPPFSPSLPGWGERVCERHFCGSGHQIKSSAFLLSPSPLHVPDGEGLTLKPPTYQDRRLPRGARAAGRTGMRRREPQSPSRVLRIRGKTGALSNQEDNWQPERAVQVATGQSSGNLHLWRGSHFLPGRTN